MSLCFKENGQKIIKPMATKCNREECWEKISHDVQYQIYMGGSAKSQKAGRLKRLEA